MAIRSTRAPSINVQTAAPTDTFALQARDISLQELGHAHDPGLIKEIENRLRTQDGNAVRNWVRMNFGSTQQKQDTTQQITTAAQQQIDPARDVTRPPVQVLTPQQKEDALNQIQGRIGPGGPIGMPLPKPQQPIAPPVAQPPVTPTAVVPPVVPPVPPPVDPMQKLRDAMAEARAMIPKRGDLVKGAQTEVDPLANQARATLQQDVARKGAEDQKALARQLASRGRIGGPASEALKGQLTSQLNASLTQGLSGVESTRLTEVNRLVNQEIDRATTFADKQFTAAAGLIALGANSDEVIKQMGVAFQNDLSKMAIQNRFVAEQAATDRNFRLQLTQIGQEFETAMAKLKISTQEKSDLLGLIGGIVGAGARIGSFLINPLAGMAVNAGLSK